MMQCELCGGGASPAFNVEIDLNYILVSTLHRIALTG